MAEKEATVYIVDVSRSMSKCNQGREISDLDWALGYIWEKITTTVGTGRKTALLGVLGLGTEKSLNDMAANGDEAYNHISLLQPIAQILMPDLRALPGKLKTSNTNSRDALSAIIIAVDMIMKTCRQLKYNKKIILVTNGTGHIDPEDIGDVAKQMKDSQIELIVLGIDFDDPEYGFQEQNKPETKFKSEATLRSLVDQCGGMFGTIQEAIDGLARPAAKLVRPTPTYRGQLRLGDSHKYDTALTIDIERYFKVSTRPAPTASSFVIKASGSSEQSNGLEPIKTLYNYTVKDESNKLTGLKDLNREDLAKGFEYGRTAVHISETDENITKLETEASYDILGFLPAENIERYMIVDNSNMLVPMKNNAKAAFALSSLIHALFELGSVAVARLVKKDMSEPIVTLLSPLVEPDFECLIENILPFAEDMRTHRFPPLDKILTMSGKTLTEHRNLPNDDLLQSTSDFVDDMSLINDDEEEMPMDDTFSPVLHTIEGAIKFRAIHPDKDVPPKPEAFLAYSRQPEELQERSKDTLRRLIKAADVKKVPPKVKGRRRYRDLEKPISGLNVDELFKKENRTTISPDNAIPEFKQIFDSPDEMDKIKSAVKQMSVIIEEWIRSSFGDKNYDRALEALGVMKGELYELEMSQLYNDVLRQLKKKVSAEELGGNRKDFWYKLRIAIRDTDQEDRSLGLIYKSEHQESADVTKEEADALWAFK